MQGIHLVITFPERVEPSVPLSLARELYSTVKKSVSDDISIHNCHIDIVDSLFEPSFGAHGTK